MSEDKEFTYLNNKLIELQKSVKQYFNIHNTFVIKLEENFNNLLQKSKEEFSLKIDEINLNISEIQSEINNKEKSFSDLKQKEVHKEFEETNYNRFSVIKQQDKTIRQCQLKINELEGKVKFLNEQNDSLKVNSKNNNTKNDEETNNNTKNDEETNNNTNNNTKNEEETNNTTKNEEETNNNIKNEEENNSKSNSKSPKKKKVKKP